MAFTPTTWVDGTTAITATELNRIETGIEDAHAVLSYGGRTFLAGGSVGVSGPTGWTISRTSLGLHRVTHNLGSSDYGLVVTVVSPAVDTTLQIAVVHAVATNYFDVKTYALASGGSFGLADLDFHFVLTPYV